MKALIIGGNRFFGKRLAHLLLQQNFEVTLLNRGKIPDGLGPAVRRITLDRKQIRPNHPALGNESWDIVYDQVCFDATEAHAACETFRQRTQKYVFTSSQSVYGPGAHLSESAFEPDTHTFQSTATSASDYAEAKRQAETIFTREMSVPLTMVRFPIVLGEDDYTGRLKFHVAHIREGKPFYMPNVDAHLSFVHAADAASFLFSLASQNVSGPVNCCSAEPIKLKNLIQRIEKSTGKLARLAVSEEDGDASPFGIETDWWMDTTKAIQGGFRARPILTWIDELIQKS